MRISGRQIILTIVNIIKGSFIEYDVRYLIAIAEMWVPAPMAFAAPLSMSSGNSLCPSGHVPLLLLVHSYYDRLGVSESPGPHVVSLPGPIIAWPISALLV